MFFKRIKTCLALLEAINWRTHLMALDLTALTATEKRLVADVETLLGVVATTQTSLVSLQARVAAGADEISVQAALDAITANLAAEAAKVESVTAPAPTGASGPAAPPGSGGTPTGATSA